MVSTVVLFTLLPALAACAGEGNIRLLEEEVAVALKSCTYPNDNTNPKEVTSDRQRRSDNTYDGTPKIDHNTKHVNQYGQERRSNENRDQVQIVNATNNDYDNNGVGNTEEKLLTSVPKSATTGVSNGNVSAANTPRIKRSDPLFNKADSDQCLSQCVFANLQVVDARGIPRETELWNRVQSSVTSQQSRSALRDQIRACFQELQSGFLER